MRSKEAKGEDIGRTTFDDLSFEDVSTGPYIGEFASYMAKTARKYMKPTEEVVTYSTAVGYMGAIKIFLIVKFKSKGIPLQLQDGIWKRYLETMRAVKFHQARKSHNPLMGTKEAATENDKKGVIAVCMWSATLDNAEFMNLFQAMVSNCGRGSEIAITKLSDLQMTDIKEDNGIEFQTFKQ